MNSSDEQLHEKVHELQETLAHVQSELIAVIRQKEWEIYNLKSSPGVRVTEYLRRRRKKIKRSLKLIGLSK